MPSDMADVSVVEGGQITMGRWTACQVEMSSAYDPDESIGTTQKPLLVEYG